jgi:hypothetical protein
MMPHSGKISDKLKKLFPAKNKAWTPKRPPESIKMPKSNYIGVPLSKGNRKGRKK